MKKILISLLIATASLAVFTACEEPEPEPVVASLSVSPSSLSFGWEGGEQTIDIQASHDWTITTSDSKVLSFSQKSGTGNATVTVKCEPATKTEYGTTFYVTVYCLDKNQKIEVTRGDKPRTSMMHIVCPDESDLTSDTVVDSEGGRFLVSTLSNTDIKITFEGCEDWVVSEADYNKLASSQTKMDLRQGVFYVLPNGTREKRHAKVVINTVPATDDFDVFEFDQAPGNVRADLIELDMEMGINDYGDGWKEWQETKYWSGIELRDGQVVTIHYANRTKDYDSEIPETLLKFPYLENLHISVKGLHGKFPEFIGQLTHLKKLYFTDLNLEGNVPDCFGELKDLELIQIAGCRGLTGPLPASLGDCPKLQVIDFRANSFTGTIPESWCKTDKSIDVMGNCLSGNFPEAFFDMPSWENNYAASHSQLPGYEINLSNMASLKGDFREPEALDLDGSSFNIKDVVESSKYTVRLYWQSKDENSQKLMAELKKYYDKYHSEGLEVIAWAPMEGQGSPDANDEYTYGYVKDHGYDAWYNLSAKTPGRYFEAFPKAEVFDGEGNIVFSYQEFEDPTYDRFNKVASSQLIPFLKKVFGPLD